MAKFRVLRKVYMHQDPPNRVFYKVQKRSWLWPFWRTLEEINDLDLAKSLYERCMVLGHPHLIYDSVKGSIE